MLNTSDRQELDVHFMVYTTLDYINAKRMRCCEYGLSVVVREPERDEYLGLVNFIENLNLYGGLAGGA